MLGKIHALRKAWRSFSVGGDEVEKQVRDRSPETHETGHTRKMVDFVSSSMRNVWSLFTDNSFQECKSPGFIRFTFVKDYSWV